MNKKFWLTILGLIAIFIVIIAKNNVDNNNKPINYGEFRSSNFRKLVKNTPEYNSLDPHKIIDPAAYTGNIPEKTIGDVKTASLILYEYADYGCNHCAGWNKIARKLVEESNGKLAVVYRGYLLNPSTGLIIASAATAAQIQGYWQEYKDLVFANQNVWGYLTTQSELKKELTDYFKQASKDKGDIERFKSDMDSEAVAKRVAFEYYMGEKLSLEGTPTFYLNGTRLKLDELVKTVKAKLAEV